MSVGYLPNAFDLINVRDLDLIAQATMHCSRLVVGVFTDDFAEQLLGRRPVVPMVERMALVAHIRGVDQVVEHDGSSLVVQPDVRIFSVAGDVALPGVGDTWLLQSTRETTSVTLREALQAVRRENVA
jgi:bifunctional ADP-heptose synthase (sugar kinase/adenylyltransferase)